MKPAQSSQTAEVLQKAIELQEKEIKKLTKERDDAYLKKAEIELELGRVRVLLNKAQKPQ